jgi:hypothetical protein
MTTAGDTEFVFVSGTDEESAALTAAAIELCDGFGTGALRLGLHVEPGGLADLVEGRASRAGFAARARARRAEGAYDLSALGSEREFDEDVERLTAAYLDDPVEAARGFLLRVAERHGTPALVEHSPDNLRHAQILSHIVPGARFVSAIRDGRDAADRMVASGEASDHEEALARWLARVRFLDAGAHGQTDGTPYALAGDHLHVTVVRGPEPLAEGSAEAKALRRFLGGETAEVGAPPTGSASHSRRLRRSYERALHALRQENAHCAAALVAAYESEAGRG